MLDQLIPMISGSRAHARAIWLSICLALAGCSDAPARPNLLLVTIDTLRADHLGCYGYPRDTSPHIDRFAAESVLFQNAFATVPKTGPAMASLFTGKHPIGHGVTENPVALPKSEVVLAEHLPRSFRKAAIVGNPTLAPARGYDDGFDTFTLTEGDSADLTDRAIDWLGGIGDDPYFLWVHYLDPHGPYRPPPELRGRFVGDEWYDPTRRVALEYEPVRGLDPNYVLGAVPRYQRSGDVDLVDWYVAQYDAEIVDVDAHVGRLLDFVRERGMLDRTLVVLTADHGESLGEHDYYFEHGMLVNEGSVHVPLLVRHPDLPPRTIDALVQSTDLLPTLLRFLDLDVPGDVHGRDLGPLLAGAPGASGREWIYAATPWPSEYRSFFETVRTAEGKLIRAQDGSLTYHDLRVDPEESEDRLAELDPADRSRLLERMALFDRGEVRRGVVPEISPELREQIRALGYVE